MNKFVLPFILINMLFTMSHSFGKSRQDLCEEVPNWKHFSDVRKYPGVKSYEKMKLAKVIGPSFIVEKINKEGWVIIDARDQIARNIFGIILNSFLITASARNKSKDEFETKLLIERFNTPTNIEKLKIRKIASIKTVEDLKNIKFAIFCNGYSCHRSTWAACKLRELGVPFENINLLLSGYSSLTEYNRKQKY